MSRVLGEFPTQATDAVFQLDWIEKAALPYEDEAFLADLSLRDSVIRGILDEDCQAQLSEVRYRELPNGKIEIEHKDEARVRGSRSPNRAEALVMAFHKAVPREQTFCSAPPARISAY